MSSPPQKSRVTVVLPVQTIAEMGEEATRQDRSISWIAQRAWRIAKPNLAELGAGRAHRRGTKVPDKTPGGRRKG